MSLSIDLSTHGRELQQVYDRIISGAVDTSWAVFTYGKGASNELKVQAQGGGELDEIVDQFSDGRIEYGFVRVEDPKTKLNKFVLIGWCGEGAPEHKKGLFHSHFLAVAKFLKGYHVQITARNESDIDPATIMNKVADSSGSKYSQLMSKFESSPQAKRGSGVSPSVSAAFGRSPGYKLPGVKKDDDGWGDAPIPTATAPTPVKSAYQPTKVDMAALRAGKSDTTSSAPSTAPELVKSTYTPIGRPDIAAIRAQSKGSPSQPSPPPKPDSTYVGTTGYHPVSLPKPKPLGGVSKFGPSVRRGGTIAPMPVGPVRESKAIGGASKNFGTDASGKTPSQLWAERKAREKGLQPGNVIPPVAPASPLPTAKISPPASPSAFVQDSSEVIGQPASGGVRAMRERFAKQSLEEDQPPISFSVRPAARPSPPARPAVPSPPPISVSSKPPPKTYQSLDDVVAAGAGAGIGLGVGALAASRKTDEDEEEAAPPPPPPAQQETWDTAQTAEEEEDEEDLAARQRSQIHTQHYEPEPEPEPEVEPEPEPEPEPEAYEPAHEEPSHQEEVHAASAAEGQIAVVLFDYEAQEENEINLIEGQVITGVEIIDEGWWSGQDPQGNVGLFPSNYVELQEPDPSNLPAVPISTTAHTDTETEPEPEPGHESAPPPPAADEGETAIAEYDYEAQEDNELSFPEGAVITHIERVDESWWAGQYEGKEGLFPANYVRMQ